MTTTPQLPGRAHADGPHVDQPATAAATPAHTAPVASAPARWARWTDAGLWAVACSGFALSYSSVQRAALAHVDHEGLSYLLPIATDGAALAAAARYVADRRAGLAGARGWQLLAWAAIAASAALNALGRDWQDALWHLVGPGTLAVITELYAYRAAKLRKREHTTDREPIPLRAWLTAPRASFRLWVWMARTGQRSLVGARRSLGHYAAALDALDTDCAGRDYQRMRDIARQQLTYGTLPPAAVLHVLGWTPGSHKPADAPTALRALLTATLTPADLDQADTDPTAAAPTIQVHVVDRPAVNPGPVGRVPGESGGSLPGPVGRVSGESGGSLPGPEHDSDATIVAAILSAATATGRLPTVNAIRTRYRVGHTRATRLRATAEGTTAHPPTAPGTSRLISRSVTTEDLRSIPSANGSSQHESKEEPEQESRKYPVRNTRAQVKSSPQ